MKRVSYAMRRADGDGFAAGVGGLNRVRVFRTLYVGDKRLRSFA